MRPLTSRTPALVFSGAYKRVSALSGADLAAIKEGRDDAVRFTCGHLSALSGQRKDYGSKTIDRIGLCRRDDFLRVGRRSGPHCATACSDRKARAAAQPRPRVDFRIPPLGRQRLRVERGKVGDAATAACTLGSSSLGSPEGRLCSRGGALAVGRNSNGPFSRHMRRRRSTGPLRSIAPWPDFPLTRNRRRPGESQA